MPGSTAFAREDALRGGLQMVQLLKANRWLWNELRRACDLDHRHGRRRRRGHWELIAVAFVVSDYVDIQPWHDNSTDELWQACGFDAKPHYRTTWRRLRELADVADEFLTAAGKLIRRARAKDPLLTDTLDGDDGAIEDDDLGNERPNDQRVFRRGWVPRNDSIETVRVMGVSLCVAR
ncbi:hypothetical protein [Conexibacter sp. DBS9H8]|uniref:hypothetical protein n=1 Tax=Conexibacter sp. DBS9H8 TaxID=2937801 RepID=UPI00200F5EFD|nr:hypothetical protein [Conexibacter sp. DBS9H8]